MKIFMGMTLCNPAVLTLLIGLRGTLCAFAQGNESGESTPLGNTWHTADLTLAVGTSFNFLDGAKPDELYYDANLFLPSVWGNFGMEFGAINNRSFSSTTFNTDRFISEDRSIISESAFIEQKYRYENFSFHAGLNYKLHDNNNNKRGVIYWNIYAEFRNRDLEFEQSASFDSLNGVSVDSTTVFKQSISTPSAFFGTGPYIVIDNGNVNIRFQPLFGIADFDQVNTLGRLSSGDFEFAYLIRYRLAHRKSGIKLGGEIRGFGLDVSEYLFYAAIEKSIDEIFGFLNN